MNGQGKDWFFRTAKTRDKCGYCGRCEGFSNETVVVEDERDREVQYQVRVCDYCGEYNGQVAEE